MSSFSKKFINTSPFKKQDPPSKSNFFSNLESHGDEFLGFPEEKARERTDEYLGIDPYADGPVPAQNSFEYGDTARHFMGGDQLSRAIQNKLKPLPYITRVALGTLGSNLGGLVHEAQNIKEGRPILESVEDAANNLAGSLGSLFSKKTSTKILDKVKKYLPDGKVKD